MFQVTFSEEEFEALRDILESSISELHTEIYHTDQLDLKAMLKSRKQVLVKMLERVHSMQNEAQVG